MDLLDQDGNNGCGNDDDFEDDNNGNCGGKADHEQAEVLTAEATQSGSGRRVERRGSGEVMASVIERSPGAVQAAAPATAPGAAGGILPLTGASLATFVLAGLVLIGTGTALVLRQRT